MKKAVVFGIGSFFREKRKRIEDQFTIVFCIDNSVSHESYDEDLGLYIYPPQKILETTNEIVLCMSRSGEEMRRQLVELGISDSRIIHGAQLFSILTSEYQNSEYEKTKAVFCELPINPCDRVFGQTKGTAVDRFYIDRFIKENSNLIRGDVVEVGSLRYTKQYMEDVHSARILHKNGWGTNAIKGDLNTGEGVPREIADCVICPQTLQYLYNIPFSVTMIRRMLKVGGRALVTVPGIKPISLFDDDNWNDLWSFTKKSIQGICDPIFSHVEVKSYGNAKVSMAYCYGICLEDISSEVLDYNDPQFPFLITAILDR